MNKETRNIILQHPVALLVLVTERNRTRAWLHNTYLKKIASIAVLLKRPAVQNQFVHLRMAN
jgi:hypothetical protein